MWLLESAASKLAEGMELYDMSAPDSLLVLKDGDGSGYYVVWAHALPVGAAMGNGPQ